MVGWGTWLVGLLGYESFFGLLGFGWLGMLVLDYVRSKIIYRQNEEMNRNLKPPNDCKHPSQTKNHIIPVFHFMTQLTFTY